MQMAILAGGLATRLGPLSNSLPKSLIPVRGKSFLRHQIELLREHGVVDLVLCIGHLGQLIREAFHDGADLGVHIRYSDEGERLLGTGGALKKAAGLLDEEFFLMWGDSYLLLDYQDVARVFRERRSDALMAVHRNENRGDKSNVILERGKVTRYDKWANSAEMAYIDEGLSVLRKGVLARIPDGTEYSIERVFAELAQEGLLDAYETPQRFYEIGSLAGLREFDALVARRSN